MRYTNGTIIALGDKVLIGGKYHGIVVADINRGEYSKENTKAQWAYLNSGIIIDTDFGGLVHYQQQTLGTEILEHK